MQMRRTLVVVVVLGAAVVSSTSRTGAVAGERPMRCNGTAAQCARTFDQVVLAGAHNAMLNPQAGFAAPEQGWSIRQQLDAGVRALLLDVYQGTPNGGQVCTDPTPLKVEQLTRQLGKESVDLLIARRNAVCPPADGPTSGLFLCHSFCEQGAVPLADELETIRAFLEANPNEVVTLILEDYADAADIDQAFDEARLTRSAVARRPGSNWPTLKKMITSGKRLVVFSERQGGTPRWLLPAFEEIQDTPFTFSTVEEFSCAASRGPADAPLLLVNHWLSSPDAAATLPTVNGREQLLARVQQCETERGMTPNIIAVNHADVGDVIAVVDELNRRRPARPAGSR
jgi:hypothetical protein